MKPLSLKLISSCRRSYSLHNEIISHLTTYCFLISYGYKLLVSLNSDSMVRLVNADGNPKYFYSVLYAELTVR